MKRNLKRLPALLLAILLCLSLLPVTAGALEISGEGWEFDLSDMSKPTLIIKTDDGMTDWITNGGSYRSIVLAVNLNEGITKIPYHAFYKCSQLTTVEIPASVTEMGKNDVFEGCRSLEEITVAAGNEHFTAEDGILYNAKKTDVLICPPGKSGAVTLPITVTRIAGSAFKDCAKLTGVTLHEGITKIENVVFEGCDSLTEVTLPATLTHLGNGAFDNCAGLTGLYVADGNGKFSSEDGVLYDKAKTELLLYPMAKLDKSLVIPDSVTSIASYAFKGARYLENVTAGELTSIGSSAFTNCEALTSFSANSLNKVEFQAFYDSPTLETFTLTEAGSLKTIEQDAFTNCSSLTGAPLDGATSIGSGAFQNCTALTSLTFCETDDVTIGSSAFSGCTGLTELTFPESVKSIESNAFRGCNKVTAVTFKSANPPECGYRIFSIGDPNEFQIVVPPGSENAYIQALGEELGSYVGDKLVKKYPLFVNGKQFTSETTSIPCGSGTASFDVTTSTLTLTNATINTMGGNYGYGGAINSGLADLTIKLVGNNFIHAEHKDYWGDTYRDSINSSSNCNIKIVSGDTGGTPTLTCDVIDMGRGGSYNGGENAGNLMVDGVDLTVNDYVFVQHDITFQNGAQVNVTGRLTANHNAVITVEGENTDVTVKSISMGNGTAHLPNDNKLVLDSGTLTVTGSVAFPGTEDGDRNPYAVHFYPKDTGSIEITGGAFQTQEGGCKATNIPESAITVGSDLIMTGSWNGGSVSIVETPPAGGEEVTVTVVGDPVNVGTVSPGGRYEPGATVTVTAEANEGWFFIGWYQGNEETAIDFGKSYTFQVGNADVTLTARFIEDKLDQAEQAKEDFQKAQNSGSLTWDILADAVDACQAVPAFLEEVKAIDGLLTAEGTAALEKRYTALTTYYKSVTTLDLSDQPISSEDIAALPFFTGVTELDLSGDTNISDLTGLTGLTNLTALKTLDLSGNKNLTDLSGLENLPALETLDLSNTVITDLTGLSGQPALKTLNLSGNKRITDLSDLSGLMTLENLNLSDTGIASLADLAQLESLKTLDISNTGVTDLGGEQSVPQHLAKLTARDLELTSISALAKMVSAENFSAGSVILWDFTDSDLPETDDNKADVKTIKGKLGSKFIAPYVPNMSEEPDEPDIPVVPGGTAGGKDDSYSVSVPAGTDIRGGAITVSPRRADKGDTVTITVEPDDGYELNKLTVTDSRGREVELTGKSGNRYTFEMPASNVKIRVSFREIAAPAVNPFTDVRGSAYYCDAVLWAVENGVTNGTTATAFSPDVTVTRAQMVTFLWRAHGAPRATGANPFTDVSADAYYYDAVLWAVESGVTNGTTATTFGPNAPVTRAQAVTFQWRAAGSPAVSVGSFADVAADAYYAGAVVWAVAGGITNGTTAATFSPDTPVSRAQAVTFLYRELA